MILKSFVAGAFALLVPVVAFAQTSSSQPLAPPAFLEDLTSPADVDKLTAEQKQALEDFLKQNPAPSLAGPMVAIPEGTVSCFDYYHFGSVQVDVEPSVAATVSGVPLTFTGTVKNDNTYPIVGGSVYAKVFRKQSDASLIHQNGHPLVDQFFVKENITLDAKAKKAIAFDWNIPRYAESGEYEIAFFFTTARRFNLLGLSFTDDVVGNKVSFRVKSAVAGGVAFDKNAVTMNGDQYRFAVFPPHFKKDETVDVAVKLSNTTAQDQSVPVIWKQYDWDALRQENLVVEKQEMVAIKAGATATLTYQAKESPGAVTYLVAEVRLRDSKSFLDMRFARDGIDQTRMNFPAVTGFPLKAGEENTVFACVHSTNAPIVENSELSIVLKDNAGTTIHAYTYQGGITAAMIGLKDTFVPEKDYDRFTLSATLKKDGKVVEALDLRYDCQTINPTLCSPKGVERGVRLFLSDNTTVANVQKVLALIIAIIALAFFLLRKASREV